MGGGVGVVGGGGVGGLISAIGIGFAANMWKANTLTDDDICSIHNGCD